MIEVTPFKKDIYILPDRTCNYAVVVEKDNILWQCSDIIYCRELFCKMVGLITNNFGHGYKSEFGNTKPEDIKIMFARKTNSPLDYRRMKQIQAGIRILDDIAGFEKLCVIKKAYHKHYSSNKIVTNIWLIELDKGWIDSPQMLSIITWFLRFNFNYRNISLNSFEEMEESLQKIYSNYVDGKVKMAGNDLSQDCAMIAFSLKIILENHTVLFDDKITGYKKLTNYMSDFYENCGIRAFLNRLGFYTSKVGGMKEEQEQLLKIVESLKSGETKLKDITKGLYKHN